MYSAAIRSSISFPYDEKSSCRVASMTSEFDVLGQIPVSNGVFLYTALLFLGQST